MPKKESKKFRESVAANVEIKQPLELTPMQRNIVLQQSKDVEPSKQEKMMTYNKFQLAQSDYFFEYIKFINEVLVILKEAGIVSDGLKFAARIKSVESAIRNDEVKALDDVFGIEICSESEEERDFVTELIKSTLVFNKEKIHDKSTGYKAYHYSGYPREIIDLAEILRSILDLTPEELDNRIDTDDAARKYMERLPSKEFFNKPDKDKGETEFTRKDETEISAIKMEAYEKAKRFFETVNSNFARKVKAIQKDLPKRTKDELIRKLIKAEKSYKQKRPKKDSDKAHLPNIEFQLKTRAVKYESSYGPASHELYKGVDISTIQDLYDNGRISPYSLPAMWSSDFTRKPNGEIEPPRMLNENEILKTLYPHLIVREPRW